MPDLCFIPLTSDYLQILYVWLQKPHVREFWDDGNRSLEQVKRHYFEPESDLQRYLGIFQKTPIAYLQTYEIPKSGHASSEWASDQTVGIDFFIGEESFLGRGVGTRFLQAALNLCQKKYSTVVVDPELQNARAIHIYRKVGFQDAGYWNSPESNKRYLMMRKSLS